VRTGAVGALTRYFISAMLKPPILTELGADYLRRTIASLLAMALITGVFLTRVFFRKYTDLGGLTYPDAYLRALQADTLFMIAVPMLIVGFVTVLLCPLLFPDEIDYQVLTPLPLTRAHVFGAKLAAVAIAGGTVIVAVSAISSFWFPLATAGRRAPYPVLARIAAHAAASVAGSAWMFAAVAALQGLTLVLIPVRWRRAGVALQATLVIVLLLSARYIATLPATLVSSEAMNTMPLAVFPAAWFFGVEQWLLDPGRADGYSTAAANAGKATGVVVLIVAATYAVLYRTAERLAGMSRISGRVRPRPALLSWIETHLHVRSPAFAVTSFIVTGLTRSRLHQFIFILISGAGAAVLAGPISTAMDTGALSPHRAQLAMHAALTAPLVASLAMTLALRAAFLLPMDRGAAWIFRLTEDAGSRGAALDAVAGFFTAAALIASLTVAAIVQPPVFGTATVFAAALTALAAWLAVEVVVADWNRLPFTCSYLPGKRVLAYNLGVLLSAYFVFVYLGAQLLRWSLSSPLRTVAGAALLTAGCMALRRMRRRTWGMQPFEFEDYDPLAVRSLGLLPDER
jgi:hypothetical protein